MTRISESKIVQQVEWPDHNEYVIRDAYTDSEIVLTEAEAGRVLYVLGTYFGVPVQGPMSPAQGTMTQ